jgi:hypothetical protein
MKSFPRDTTLKKVNMKEINRLAQDHVKKIKEFHKRTLI